MSNKGLGGLGKGVLPANDKNDPKRPALGRGLSALIPGAPATPTPQRGLMNVPVTEVSPDRDQPRRYWNQAAVEELAASVKARGIIQPILVRRIPEGGYRIIAGERRWRASQIAGLSEIPVIVKEVSETEVFELALIENIQRQDLNPIEEAEAYNRLLSEHGLTQEDLAGRVGKERSTITNSLRLLKLPPPVREHLVSGTLSVGHAKALLGVDEAETMHQLADQVAAKGLSVRDTEKLVQKTKQPQPEPAKARVEVPAELKFLVRKLERLLDLPVEIHLKTEESGELTIRFESLGKADELLQSLVGELDRADLGRPTKESA
jgi:ParB family chromosome partitioning protein